MLTLMAAQTNPPAPFAGVNATWNYTLGSIVVLFLLLDFLIVTDVLARFAETRSGFMLALALMCVAASATRIRYCWFLRGGSGERMPHIGWTLALFAPAVVAWAFAFVTPEASLFAAAQLWFSGVLFSTVARKSLRWPIVLLALVLSLLPLLIRGLGSELAQLQVDRGASLIVVIYGLLLPFMLISSLWLWRVVARLDEARHLSAELAVTQERLRFAADLHDIQGHHLQVIALKAELVERTLQARPDYAAEQAGEIRLIAKEAMEETRSLVSGLREVGLRAELENASEVLTLSGAECSLRVTATPASGDAQRVLAFVVREATTNILRHSDATEAAITLAQARGGFELAVTNNGVAEGSLGVAGSAPGQGSGLAGLRERVAALGGSLTAGVDGGLVGAEPGTFTLTVWVPEGAEQ